jgi:hypothetical protein
MQEFGLVVYRQKLVHEKNCFLLSQISCTYVHIYVLLDYVGFENTFQHSR